MNSLQKFSGFLASRTAFVVLGAVIIALILPDIFTWVKGGVQTLVLGGIMLTMGMTLSAKDYKILLCRPWDIFAGVCAQYILMPLIAYALVHAFNLPKGIAVGLLLVGTCPGGVSSNIMSYLAKGDVAFSVGMTTASTLLSPVMTPMLMLWLSGESVAVDAMGMFKSILYVTLLPVCAGSLLNFSLGRKKSYIEAMKLMPALSVIGLACIVGGVTAYHGRHFFSSGIAILFAIILHNALGYFTGYLAARGLGMGIAQRRTLSIEVGCQNAGLATNLASKHFVDMPEAAVASAVACVWHSFSGTVLANLFSVCGEGKLETPVESEPAEKNLKKI